VSDLDGAGKVQRFRRPATPERKPDPASYQLPDSVAAASGRWTRNSPFDSARTVDVFVCPASSSKACSENGDRNRMPIERLRSPVQLADPVPRLADPVPRLEVVDVSPGF
jgi:hypothetical protein